MKNNIKKMEKSVEKFLKRAYPDGIIIKEYGRVGIESRPDYAVFTQNKIIYVELKGNKDSPNRLDRQMFFYKRMADKVILVLDKKYSRNIALKYSKRGISVLYFKSKKKKLDTKLGFANYNPFEVTDILKLLYSEELKYFTQDFENSQTMIKNMEDRMKIIKAIYSQLEIKEMATEILFNRMSAWHNAGRKESNYGFGRLESKIFFKETKREMFMKFLYHYSTIENNKVNLIGD